MYRNAVEGITNHSDLAALSDNGEAGTWHSFYPQPQQVGCWCWCLVPALETVEAAAAEAGTREHWRMHAAAAGLADEILEVVKLTMQHLFTFLFSYTKVY